MAVSIIKQAVYSLMLEMPFFARLLLEMKIVEKEEIKCHNGAPTYAATDGERLFICVKMYKKLNEKQKLGLICHEVLHCALGHIWRRNHKDPMQWNMACDYIVNQIVLENNMLRSLDALHLSCAIIWNSELFISSDKRQIQAAENSGLQVWYIQQYG